MSEDQQRCRKEALKREFTHVLTLEEPDRVLTVVRRHLSHYVRFFKDDLDVTEIYSLYLDLINDLTQLQMAPDQGHLWRDIFFILASVALIGRSSLDAIVQSITAITTGLHYLPLDGDDSLNLVFGKCLTCIFQLFKKCCHYDVMRCAAELLSRYLSKCSDRLVEEKIAIFERSIPLGSWSTLLYWNSDNFETSCRNFLLNFVRAWPKAQMHSVAVDGAIIGEQRFVKSADFDYLWIDFNCEPSTISFTALLDDQTVRVHIAMADVVAMDIDDTLGHNEVISIVFTRFFDEEQPIGGDILLTLPVAQGYDLYEFRKNVVPFMQNLMVKTSPSEVSYGTILAPSQLESITFDAAREIPQPIERSESQADAAEVLPSVVGDQCLTQHNLSERLEQDMNMNTVSPLTSCTPASSRGAPRESFVKEGYSESPLKKPPASVRSQHRHYSPKTTGKNVKKTTNRMRCAYQLEDKAPEPVHQEIENIVREKEDDDEDDDDNEAHAVLSLDPDHQPIIREPLIAAVSEALVTAKPKANCTEVAIPEAEIFDAVQLYMNHNGMFGIWQGKVTDTAAMSTIRHVDRMLERSAVHLSFKPDDSFVDDPYDFYAATQTSRKSSSKISRPRKPIASVTPVAVRQASVPFKKATKVKTTPGERDNFWNRTESMGPKLTGNVAPHSSKRKSSGTTMDEWQRLKLPHARTVKSGKPKLRCKETVTVTKSTKTMIKLRRTIEPASFSEQSSLTPEREHRPFDTLNDSVQLPAATTIPETANDLDNSGFSYNSSPVRHNWSYASDKLILNRNLNGSFSSDSDSELPPLNVAK